MSTERVVLPPDRLVVLGDLVPGVVAKRYTAPVGGRLRVLLPCHEEQAVWVDPARPADAVCAVRGCRRRYEVELSPDDDSGFFANLTVSEVEFLLSRRFTGRA